MLQFGNRGHPSQQMWNLSNHNHCFRYGLLQNKWSHSFRNVYFVMEEILFRESCNDFFWEGNYLKLWAWTIGNYCNWKFWPAETNWLIYQILPPNLCDGVACMNVSLSWCPSIAVLLLTNPVKTLGVFLVNLVVKFKVFPLTLVNVSAFFYKEKGFCIDLNLDSYLFHFILSFPFSINKEWVFSLFNIY